MMKNIQHITAAILCVLVVSGCGPTNSEAVEFGKDSVKAMLKDPDSAKFSEVDFYPELDHKSQLSGYVCGEVNAKNSFGAYSGKQLFYSRISINDGNKKSIITKLIDNNDSSSLITFKSYCQK